MAYYGATESNEFNLKILNSIDEKNEKAIFNSGNFRNACSSNASYGSNTYDMQLTMKKNAMNFY